MGLLDITWIVISVECLTISVGRVLIFAPISTGSLLIEVTSFLGRERHLKCPFQCVGSQSVAHVMGMILHPCKRPLRNGEMFQGFLQNFSRKSVNNNSSIKDSNFDNVSTIKTIFKYGLNCNHAKNRKRNSINLLIKRLKYACN